MTKDESASLNQKCAYCGHALKWHDPHGCNHLTDSSATRDIAACYCDKFLVSVETGQAIEGAEKAPDPRNPERWGVTTRQISSATLRIVDRLLTNGFDEKGDRLVIVANGKQRDLGGWNRIALLRIIAEELGKYRPKPKPKSRELDYPRRRG